MQKSLRAVVSLILTVMLLFSSVPIYGILSSAEDTTMQTICFGSYPQSRVDDAGLISALDAMEKQWVSYGYYCGTNNVDGLMAPSDFMQYADIEYAGQRYRAVTFSAFRPAESLLETNLTGEYSFQDDNGYAVNQTYYFRFEPLRWEVLDEDAGLIVCEQVIDAQAFNDYVLFDSSAGRWGAYFGDADKTAYANNYEFSGIREWLNDTFYQTAFSAEEHTQIAVTHVANNVTSLGNSSYQYNDTDDKIFLLNTAEVKNASYDFSTSDAASPTRVKEASDYALCQGVEKNAAQNGVSWFLRTPGFDSNFVCRIERDGKCDSTGVAYTYDSLNGTVPALKLNVDVQDFYCNHNYEITENDENNHMFTCTNCGKSYTQQHSFEIVNQNKERHTYACSVCGFSYQEAHAFAEGVCTVCGAADEAQAHNGDIISYGQYPQSRVTDETLLAELEQTEKQWISYEYYINDPASQTNGQMHPADFMKYADIEYNGETYRAVTFSRYRPYSTSYPAYPFPVVSEQGANGYTTDTVYYFKFEPIRWKVLDADAGLVLSTSALDSQSFHPYLLEGNGGYYGDPDLTAYASDYVASSIRAWLNQDFYNTAFSTEQKERICETNLFPGKTADRVFFLSKEEVTNTAYGFGTDNTADVNRIVKSTDYAAAQGCRVSTEDGTAGNVGWWLRDEPLSSSLAAVCRNNGTVQNNEFVLNTCIGVVPAMQLENLRFECIEHTFTCIENDRNTHTLLCSVCGYQTTRAHTYSGGECSICGVKDPQQPEHPTVAFGSYPQSIVTDADLITALDAAAKDWHSYGYYTGTGSVADGNMQPSDFMQYADIQLENERYRAVTFSAYRPANTGEPAAAEAMGDSSVYELNTIYYFKYEPILWRVLDASTGLVICTSVIDSQPYQNVVYQNAGTYYVSIDCASDASDYAASSVRQWLNNDFYNTAFSESEKKVIADNNEIISDRVFLLSFEDVQNAAYGFDALPNVMNGSRDRDISDYAICQGGAGDSGWMTRTPADDVTCYDAVTLQPYSSAVNATAGVVPAMHVGHLPGYDCIHHYVSTAHNRLSHTLTCTYCDNTYETKHIFENGVCTVCGQDQVIATENGEIIQFGQYPQSKVTDAQTIAALDAVEKNWISYRYYTGSGHPYNGSMKPGDCMEYADLEYNGDMYRAVLIHQYRPYSTTIPADGIGEQEGNGYLKNIVYYFRYEPLEWKVLDAEDGLIVCTKAIDAQTFNNYAELGSHWFGDAAETYYTSDYARSDIRKWLNNTFYTTAFNTQEQAIIADTMLNMQDSGSSEADLDTADKVFLLSLNDITNPDYGFSASQTENDSARLRTFTDYTLSQGGRRFNNAEYTIWYTRTAAADDFAYIGSYDGTVASLYTYWTGNAIVPALKIEYLQGRCFNHRFVCTDIDAQTHHCVCSVCGYETTQAHAFSEDWQYVQKPTLFTDGIKAKVCACGRYIEAASASRISNDVSGEGSFVYGLSAGMTAEQFVQSKINSEYADMVSVQPSSNVQLGTGSVITVSYDDGTSDSYTCILFGDVNGDGIYDAQDSIIVNCIANGLFSREQVGEANDLAADCNHDGEINSSDVLLLEQAGLLLASVNQTASQEELMQSDSYMEYLNLIDQNPAGEEPVPEEPTEPAPAPVAKTMIEIIIEVVKTIITFIRGLFPKI